MLEDIKMQFNYLQIMSMPRKPTKLQVPSQVETPIKNLIKLASI